MRTLQDNLPRPPWEPVSEFGNVTQYCYMALPPNKLNDAVKFEIELKTIE